MTNTEAQGDAAKRGKRYPLLYQQRLGEQLFWLCVIIIAMCAALLIWSPERIVPYRIHLMVVLTATGLTLILTQVWRLRAYVQCREQALHLRFPFYRLDIPYNTISATRPTQLHYLFSPQSQRWTQRSFLSSLWGRTVIVVDIDDFAPKGRNLRPWVSPYMLSPDSKGLVLLIRDWMDLRGELDEAIALHRRRF